MTFNLFVPGKDHEPGLSYLELPVFETALTPILDHMASLQKGPCARHEMDFARCAARVGLQKSRTECTAFLQDMHECVHRLKVFERYRIMQAERKKQGRTFLDPPPKDSIHTWCQ